MKPSPKSIELALSAATERFAAELAQPQMHAPSWSGFEWQMARAAAVLHGVTPLLAKTLRWSGPDNWQSFVTEQHHQTILRHRRIAAVLEEITDRAVAAGLAFVALKGAALHSIGLYLPGERPMADIDLLVTPADRARAAKLLASMDFAYTGATWKDELFERPPAAGPGPSEGSSSTLPLGEHETYPVKVELHTRIAERLPVSEAEITQLVFPEDPRPGLNPYPSTSILLLHLLLHAAGNLSGRSFRLIQLHDIALLAAGMSGAQWEETLEMTRTPKGFWWAFPPLAMVNRYRPGLVPQQVLSAFRSGCAWRLRRQCQHASVSRLSYASVSIPVFPAMPWCSSLHERLKYVRQRLLPSREHLASRAMWANDHWARQHAWSHMSQGRRMLQWLITRPVRQETMYIVEAALLNPSS
jgi:hypothetical protein